MLKRMKLFKGFVKNNSQLVLKKQVGHLEQKHDEYKLVIYSNRNDRLFISSEVDPFKNYDFKVVSLESLAVPAGFGYLVSFEGKSYLKIKFKTSSQEFFAPMPLESQPNSLCA
jgi:hypothetical protein